MAIARREAANAVSIRAFAKINLTLRITERRPDGYHGLRTVLQSIGMHDTLTFVGEPGPFRIECDDPACPTDRTNLVWRAAAMVWHAAGRRGDVRDVAVRIAKRIPLQAGLGGGSSDAAAAIRGLAALWRLRLPDGAQHQMAARLGADVPFFFQGGTAVGVDRGDLLFPLIDLTPRWLTVVVPSFGVSTKDAYGWFDDDGRPAAPAAIRQPSSGRRLRLEDEWLRFLPPSERGNDLQAPVAARHPAITRIVRALRRGGAVHAAMSGSGSAVFGMFASRTAAERAARELMTAKRRAVVTPTINRGEYAASSTPVRGRRRSSVARPA
jgi:4-diphosphocytidyl-2-C-methyl-D-erythritol kinase